MSEFLFLEYTMQNFFVTSNSLVPTLRGNMVHRIHRFMQDANNRNSIYLLGIKEIMAPIRKTD